jgi:holo-[acyl-carrier protein] synthase
MITGIGTDIVDINSFIDLFKKSTRFKLKIFTENEIIYCESKPNKYQHYAARFAAKEAVMKAIGTGWDKGVHWKQIEVKNCGNGRPILVFSDELRRKMDVNNINISHISISHSKTQVITFVVLETI